MQRLMKWAIAATAVLVVGAGGATAEVNELRIGYQPSPIQDASIAMFESWGAKNGVKIVKVPNSYGVYVEKMTASLTSNSDQYDVIWHNDDWGQTWAHLLEPTDDVDANKYAEKWGMAPVVFANADSSTAPTSSSPRRCRRRSTNSSPQARRCRRRARSSSAMSAAWR
jgi:ABC-type glycerol-3-phosphate transport system substrate-binding protein